MAVNKLISAVREIYGTNDFIALHEPSFGEDERENLTDCIDSTFVSSVGAYVDGVEKELGFITGTTKATAVVNGTAALQVGLRIADVTTGDEVLTQSLTFVATANAISYLGANPIFIDVDIDTLGLSPVALEKWLTECAEIKEGASYNKTTGKRIAACVPMHTFGIICRIEEIVSICDRWGIPVVEDAAESLGSSQAGKAAGTWGLLGALSFNGNKIVTSGGGGAVISTNDELIKRAKFLTTTAKEPHAYDYVHNEVGYNFRMPNLNAALLQAQLNRLPLYIEKKKQLFAQYKQMLGRQYNFVNPPIGQQWNHWLITIMAEDKQEQEEILQLTNESGVMTRPIWRLMHSLPMYEGCQRDEQKNALYMEQRIINIPSSVR